MITKYIQKESTLRFEGDRGVTKRASVESDIVGVTDFSFRFLQHKYSFSIDVNSDLNRITTNF